MAAERDLEAAAERGAVDRGDHRLAGVFDAGDDLAEAGRLRRLAEFGDVGAGDEGTPAAGQDDAFDLRVGDGGGNVLVNPATNCRAERIDRGTVDRDDGNVITAFKLHHFTHARLSLSVLSLFRSAKFNSTS